VAISQHHRLYQTTQLSSRRYGSRLSGGTGGSGSWEIMNSVTSENATHDGLLDHTDHVALTIEEEDHEVIYINESEDDEYNHESSSGRYAVRSAAPPAAPFVTDRFGYPRPQPPSAAPMSAPSYYSGSVAQQLHHHPPHPPPLAVQQQQQQQQQQHWSSSTVPMQNQYYSAQQAPPPPPHAHTSYQYQNVGGAATMTQERLRRFEQHYNTNTATTRIRTTTNTTDGGGGGAVPITSPAASRFSPSSSIALTAWKLEQRDDFYRLEDYHTVFRVPHHVPDARYHEYVLGRLGQQRKKESSMLTKACCAQTCALFSGVAVCFLLWIGILLDTQPLYIPGTLQNFTVQSTVTYAKSSSRSSSRRSGGSTTNKSKAIPYTRPRIEFLIPGPTSPRLPIATTAYRAALAYFVSMLVSLYCLDPAPVHRVLQRLRRQCFGRYEDIPEVPNASSEFHRPSYTIPRPNSGDLFGGPLLPQHHHRGAYQPSLWHQTINRIKRWLAVKGWYRARKVGGPNGEKKKG
jgi:hypothetical protein